jgi:ubiquitin-protein ligase E3 A
MQKLEEDELKGESQEDDYDEIDEKTCLHKNEGLTGAVGFLRLIYYASILGGRMDPQSQLENERALEQTENAYFENIIAVEIQPTSGTIFTDIPSSNFLVTSKMIDPLEDLFKVRALDCREPKIPFDEFVNELANEHIDIQHDYVEYAHILQHLESRQNNNNGANTRSLNWTNMKKRVFSYLAHPFFLTLSKKNIGLYYDNKIKMMRERRNHIMLSILEGRSPTPFFKMRLTRENLLFNALSLIEMQEEENPSTLRKQLFIEFENEEGIDQGGLSKEFFQLAIDELLNKGFSKLRFI